MSESLVSALQFNASRSQLLKGVAISRMEASTTPSLMRVGLDLPLRSISTLRTAMAEYANTCFQFGSEQAIMYLWLLGMLSARVYPTHHLLVCAHAYDMHNHVGLETSSYYVVLQALVVFLNFQRL